MIATIYPDRITVRQSRQTNIFDLYEKKLEKEARKQHKKSLENLKINRRSFALSKATKRKIKDTFSLLYSLTPERKIEYRKNKYIYNFRLSFVTLTLPAPQRHTDTEIKEKCLNNFLNIMRNRFGLKNYIWIAELQKNQNIHFHLVFDLYINYHAVRYYWNQSLELLGYISAYSAKFSKMSLSEYAKHRQKPINEVAKHFAQSCRNGWTSPGTEQVKAIKNQKSLAYYLSKYITKNSASDQDVDEERLASFGRSWSRSQSLSRIKYVTRWDWDSIKFHVDKMSKKKKFINKRIFDYCTVYYFDLRRATSEFIRWITKHMRSLGYSYGYEVSGFG